MKHLVSEPQTKNILRRWAQSDDLIVTKHFFWHAGTTLQKSQHGLLQSLLYQLLSQLPEVIPKVCAKRWHAQKLRSSETVSEPWMLPEMAETINLIQYHGLPGARLCVFIDGLDEYDGDHRDIIDLIFRLAESPKVKICELTYTQCSLKLSSLKQMPTGVSSRPRNIFLDTLANTPTITLEDLTAKDMKVYVEDRIGNHPNFKSLRAPALSCKGLIKVSVLRGELCAGIPKDYSRDGVCSD